MADLRVAVIILTKDEEKHLARCMDSVASFASECLVVDSGSTDRTLEIAREKGARVLSKSWVNYASQMNWSIGNVTEDVNWIMRLDADEYVLPELASEICRLLPRLDADISGVYVSRRIKFMGRVIRYGGVFPVRVLRLFRRDRGLCENRWMDEHIRVLGETADFKGEIIDDNTKSLTWWTDKHNAYASREVVDLLNLEFGFMVHETVADLRSGKQAGVKRWVKEKVYFRLPSGFRVLAYFSYRYFFRLGFLDGREGAAFHLLQGFWYRYLVDMKLWQVKEHMRNQGVGVVSAIKDILGIDVISSPERAPQVAAVRRGGHDSAEDNGSG